MADPLYLSPNVSKAQPIEICIKKNDETTLSSSPKPLHKKYIYVLLILWTAISLALEINHLSHTKYGIVSTQEKYLTYLPHSGLHNQRIALENAIFLAWALNRTLILPPLILGDRTLFGFKISPRSFGLLESKLSYLYQVKRDNCKDSKDESELLRCKSFRDSYTFYDWDKLFNFTFVLENVKVIRREDLIPENLFSKLDVSKEQILRIEGNYKNHTIHDKEIHKRRGRQKHYSIMELSERDEELIYFNSLFGSGVIQIKSSRNLRFMGKIKDSMTISQPTLLDITEKISNRLNSLGGNKEYLGVHARVGDGQYKESSEQNIKKLIHDIKRSDLTKSFKTIYLASDVTSKSDTLRPIFEEFPYTLMLESFQDLLTPMDRLINEKDGKRLKKFLIPILDLMVAANGNHVLTIRGSTSAGYLRRYHGILRRRQDLNHFNYKNS